MKFLAMLVVVLMLAGCASYMPHGMLFTGGKMGAQGGSGAADKSGKACMNSVLGLVAWGDASLQAAKAAGGVKDVVNIEYEVNNVLGIWGEYCIIVQGR
jgi:hypothetical protein